MKLVRQAEDGSLTLRADEGKILGKSLELEGDGALGRWGDVHDRVRWNATIVKPGRFEVHATISCEPVHAGSRYAVIVGDNEVTGTVASTGNFGNFVTVNLGQIKVTKAGPIIITVKPLSKPGGAVMNLRSIELLPVK